MSSITAIIVDYYKSELVQKGVKSILRQKGDFDLQIIIVDNAPDADQKKHIPMTEAHKNIHVSFPRKNIGYSRANNLAAKKSESEYFFVLNPDIQFSDTDVFQKIIDAFKKDPQIAIIGTRQLCPNGKIESTVRRFPSPLAQICRRTFFRHMPLLKNLVQRYECNDFDYSKTQEVDWLQSSFWAVKRGFWKEIGGFDERYFVFMADTEMCYQAWKRGKKVVYIPDPCVQADGIRASSGGVMAFFRKKVLRIHAKDALRYFWKHLFEKNPRNR